RKVTDFKPSIDLPNLEQLLLSFINNPATIEKEVRDQENHWYTLRIRPYRTIDHKIDGAVLLFLDIDATKKASIESEEARGFSDAIVDTVRHPILILDGSLCVERANAPFYREFQVKAEATERRPLFEIGERQWEIPRLKTLLEEVLARNTRFESFEVEHDFPGIGHKTMLLYGRRIMFKHKQEPKILLCMEDITQRRKSETAIRKINQTLEGHVVDRTAQLASSRGELEAFSYTVAHDLRAPLRAMHGFSQLVIEDYKGKVLGEPAEHLLKRIMDASRKMDALIQDLLAYSRLTREEIELGPVDLAVAMNALLAEWAPAIEQKAAEVVMEGALPAVRGHRTLVWQVLTNLLSNALKFTAPGVNPRIRIRVQKHGPGLRLIVEDNGIGIAPEYHERIFRVFERLNKTEEYPGTGIGLAIV